MIVTGIGQCSWDYLAVVPHCPDVDTKNEVSKWEEQGGGPVATALVALSRLGVSCKFFGVAGSDEEGKKIRDSLHRECIDINGLFTRTNSNSQVAFIVIEEVSAKRTIFWRRPTGDELGTAELGDDFLKGSCFLLLDGLMHEVSLFAARKARELGIPVMVDAGRLREGMLELASLCDYVVGSETFARDLGWNGDPGRFQKKIKELFKGITTITLGEKGSLTYVNDEIIEVPAYRVAAVDTTGAGDVFHAGYIYGLLRRWDIVKTLKFASAFAALKCEMIGGRAGIPDFLRVKDFLEKQQESVE